MQHLSVEDVATRLRLGHRATREYLRQLDDKYSEQHGHLLFRRSKAANGKLWVDLAVLAKILPAKFGEISDMASVVEINARLEQLEADISELRSEVNGSRRKGKR